MLRVWNISLLVATFALTILGTFLTRVGRAHERARVQQRPDRAVPARRSSASIVVVSLALIAWRGDRLRSPGAIDSPVSREGAFLANNVMFTVFAFVVLLGTVFPLIVEALQDRQIAVGAPFFDRLSHADRAHAAVPDGGRPGAAVAQGERRAAARPAVLAGVVRRRCARRSPSLVGADGLAPLLAFGLGGFAAGAALRQLVLATRRQGWRGPGRPGQRRDDRPPRRDHHRRRARRVEQLHPLGEISLDAGRAGRRTAGTRSSSSTSRRVRATPASAGVQGRRAASTAGRCTRRRRRRYINFGRTCRRRACAPGCTEDIYLTLERRGRRPATPRRRSRCSIKPMVAVAVDRRRR